MATKVVLKNLSTEELKLQLANLRKEIRETRFQFGMTRTIANPAKFRKARKDVARIMTLMHEKSVSGKPN